MSTLIKCKAQYWSQAQIFELLDSIDYCNTKTLIRLSINVLFPIFFQLEQLDWFMFHYKLRCKMAEALCSRVHWLVLLYFQCQDQTPISSIGWEEGEIMQSPSLWVWKENGAFRSKGTWYRERKERERRIVSWCPCGFGFSKFDFWNGLFWAFLVVRSWFWTSYSLFGGSFV